MLRRAVDAGQRTELSHRASERLNVLRALAALTVAVGHLRALFFVHFEQVREAGIVTRAVYFATSLGHQAVIAFFVLSGFFIGPGVVRTVLGARWQWRRYLNRRMTRLWIVLLPALVLGAVLDRTGIAAFGASGVYAADPHYLSIQPEPVTSHLNALTALGNALFVQGILVPTLGSNGPLWSLANEFWYYLAFPLLALAALARSRRTRALCFLALAAGAVFVGRSIAAYFLIWLAGVAVFFVPEWRPMLHGNRARRVLSLIVVLLGIVALLAAKYLITGSAGDFVLTPVVALVVYLLAHQRPHERAGPSAIGSAFTWLASFSYTLYLVHLPVLVFIRALADHNHVGLWQPSAVHMGEAAALAIVVVLFAYGVAVCTEKRTDRVRRWVSALTREHESARELALAR